VIECVESLNKLTNRLHFTDRQHLVARVVLDVGPQGIKYMTGRGPPGRRQDRFER
jgi:hypothetical protein